MIRLEGRFFCPIAESVSPFPYFAKPLLLRNANDFSHLLPVRVHGIGARAERADRRSDDHVDRDAAFLHGFDDADMRQSPRASAAEDEGDWVLDGGERLVLHGRPHSCCAGVPLVHRASWFGVRTRVVSPASRPTREEGVTACAWRVRSPRWSLDTGP